MVRTIAGVIILIGVVVWLPIWAQLVFFAAAIILLSYQYVVLIPAVIGDALYAPTGQIFSLANHWLLIIVGAMLIIYWYVMKKMRVQRVYGLEA